MGVDHFPSAQKGKRIIFFLIAIIGLPLIPMAIGTFLLMILDDKEYSIFPEMLTSTFFTVPAFSLGIWGFIDLLKENPRARQIWIGVCILMALYFLAMGFYFIYWQDDLVFPFFIALIYLGFVFAMYRNRHITAFFQIKQQKELIGKIEKLGDD